MPSCLLKLFLAFACCLSLPAKDITSIWFDDGKFLEESDSQRMTNGFGGRLDFTIKRPDGTVCNHFTNLPAVKQPLPIIKHLTDDKPTLRLSPKFVIFQIDPPDPVGTYTVEVELRDRLKGTRVKLKKQLLVNK
ncbi:MAG TPA: hypothetical protein VK815_04320 [Candidatus Acidoferrales bacterium]|jgi:hypothetical protein|nr:hypothetical protein [Candidatus Acidoferrales bacterium]